MTDRLGKRRWLLCLLGVSVLAGAGFLVWHNRAWIFSLDPAFPEPPYSETRFLNTGPDAHFIGIAACAECHPRNHKSYLLTAHSQALSDLDPNAEPPDGSFDHPTSGRSYRVYRQGKEMRHQETVRTPEGNLIAHVDVPIRYLIGSGHFTRSYLVEVDGFLHESPITWYTSRKQWGMSPGYDAAQHWGFERPIEAGCLVCHAGRAEPIDGTVHRLALHEKAIGCENCHGPGSVHQQARRASKLAPGEEDLTIVNPGKLSRPLQEAVCAQCHLNGPAIVHLRGRRLADFRPGRPLTDYRIDYRFDADSDQMTVVGHVEQLRRSACYTKSNDLTCVTCHDPHAAAKPKDPVAFYRQKCLTCHTNSPVARGEGASSKGCALPRADRLKKDAADSCVACHMPRGDTDIPHVAFTHHRIGKHLGRKPAGPGPTPRLEPTEDVANLPPLDRQRNLGLAYLKALQNPDYAAHAEAFRERARDLLETVRGAGLLEGETAAALAEIYWQKDPPRCLTFARKAIEAKTLPAEIRARTLLFLAAGEMQERNFQAAAVALEELVRLRRQVEDWRLLGQCYHELDQPAKAISALDNALAIRPYRPSVHAGLADVFRRTGDFQRANEHQHKAQWLMVNRQN